MWENLQWASCSVSSEAFITSVHPLQEYLHFTVSNSKTSSICFFKGEMSSKSVTCLQEGQTSRKVSHCLMQGSQNTWRHPARITALDGTSRQTVHWKICAKSLSTNLSKWMPASSTLFKLLVSVLGSWSMTVFCELDEGPASEGLTSNSCFLAFFPSDMLLFSSKATPNLFLGLCLCEWEHM